MHILSFKLIRKCTDGINASVDHLITNKYCNHARFIRTLMANGSRLVLNSSVHKPSTYLGNVQFGQLA